MTSWKKRVQIWLVQMDETEMRRSRRIGLRSLRFAYMLAEQFVHDRCLQKAAALTYTTILSLFPLLAVVSIFATRFTSSPEKVEANIARYVEEYLLPTDKMEESPLVIEGQDQNAPAMEGAKGSAGANANTPAASSTETAPAKTSGANPPDAQHGAFVESILGIYRTFRDNAGKIAGIGAIGLLLAAIALFSTCEKFFNEIWRVQTRRGFARMFSAFATVLVSLPALIAATAVVSRFFNEQREKIELVGGIGPIIQTLVRVGGYFGPLVFASLALACAFYMIPNTRVRFRSALIGGILAGVLWYLAKKSFFLYVTASDIRRSVFDAFGAPLIFLVWLYILWVIILLGAETAYLSQHLSYVFRERFGHLRVKLTDPRLYVLVLGRIGQAFQGNQGGIDLDTLRSQTNLRESDLEGLLAPLMENGFVAARDDNTLILNRPAENISLKTIFDLGCQSASLAPKRAGRDDLVQQLKSMDLALPDRYGDKSLADILKTEASAE